jgi:ABC-2 type transport system permease protein
MSAIRLGLQRGWISFRNIITTPDGIRDTVIWNGLPLVLLILGRNSEWPGTSLSASTVALPGVLGMIVAAGALLGPAWTLSSEREDGTLLRARAVPYGLRGYMAGVISSSCLEALLGVALILIPSLLLFEGFSLDAVGAFTIVWVLVLGLLATLPIGIIIGSVAKSARSVGGLGFIVVGGLVAISGIFFPNDDIWEPLQWLAQALPIYWVGLGMRSAVLPDAAAAAEIGGSWRTLETAGVLAAWSIAGLIAAPRVLRRMARRESGSLMEARRQALMQRLG